MEHKDTTVCTIYNVQFSIFNLQLKLRNLCAFVSLCSVKNIPTLVVHLVGQCQRKHIALGMEIVKQADEVGFAIATYHEVDGRGT